jgi:hypothetical protein
MASNLAPHPRLYLGPPELARLRQPAPLAILQTAQDALEKSADRALQGTEFDFGAPSHNDLLIRARRMQGRLMSLLVRWEQTGEAKYRQAALDHVRAMGEWRDWSWIAMRQDKHEPDAIFDLSYGENSANLAIAYSWLHNTLSPAERELFVSQARDRALKSFLKHTEPSSRAWWFGRKDSNWNTVCAGGAGMLALAMMEDLPEMAAKTLALVEESFPPFIHELTATGGGWPEGIGYWNYGFRYAFMYLLSWERAMRRPHPLMAVPELKISLGFNQVFCPNSVPCSFGDVNHWSPAAFHFAACQRLGRGDLIPDLTGRISSGKLVSQGWPEAEELRLLHPGTIGEKVTPVPHFAMYCRGLDWLAMADQFPEPKLYVNVRGGTTEVPHGHMDLLSYNVVVGDEGMISNIGVGEYLDTTFSARRWELFETTPPSKNTILVNGVGISRPSRVAMTQVTGIGVRGVRLDASEAMGKSRDGGAVRFTGRLVLLVDEQAVLLVDRVIVHFPARAESRLHTHTTPTLSAAGALLQGKRQALTLVYAADRPAILVTAKNAPTTPTQEGANMLRWCTQKLVADAVTLVTLMLPGQQKGELTVTSDATTITITGQAGALKLALRLDAELNLLA